MKRAATALAIFIVATGAAAKSGRHIRSVTGPRTMSAVKTPDGEWRIEATTTVGTCGGLIPASLTIADHKIAGASGVPSTSWGYVDDAGQIVARFTQTGGRVVRLHGELGGASGSGAWSSSTDLCGGVWRAIRR